MARRFMFVSIGVFFLALSALIGFHIGSRTAVAQVNPLLSFTAADDNTHYVIDAIGDVWVQEPAEIPGASCAGNSWLAYCEPARYIGNFFTGPPLATSPETWGGIKNKYDGDNK